VNKVKKQGKRVLSLLLCTALAMSGLIVPTKQVRAEESQAQETSTTTKTIAGLGTSVIVDPTAPANDTDAWKGSYVYYGNYNSSPVKYRVLDASTTDYSADGTTQTMLLDCDSVLYYQKFDNDGTANEAGKKANDWSISNVKSSLNGDGFLNKEGVFTTAEKNAIAASTVGSHALTTDSENGVKVSSWTQSNFVNYVALTGEQIFLLDAEDVSNGAYGYSMTDESCENRKKTGSSAAYWWLRSAYRINDSAYYAGYVRGGGDIYEIIVYGNNPGVSPALNLNLSSVLFSSVISGTAGETGAEYKLTLLDGDMTIAPGSGVTKSGNTVTIPYSISGTNSANATQVSVLILDKEYTAGNTNGAKVLAYDKLNVENFSTTGTGTYTLPDSLSDKKAGSDYYVYLMAEDVNEEKETDYASTPVEIYLWEAPTVKQMNFGTQGIIDPAVPNSASDAWKGCYVYYGNYDADGDGIAEPVKYRVLDASTTDYSEDGMTQTMFLDCDSVLFKEIFDDSSNVWADSDLKNSLNGDGFLNNEGVFTTAEKNAIAASTVDPHVLTTDSKNGINVAEWTQSFFVNYVALTGKQIFLLDAEDVSNGAYGYSMTVEATENRKKAGSAAAYWWLRSADNNDDDYAGCVTGDGHIGSSHVDGAYPGVSPALNLNLSSVLFSSANAVSKSSALTSGSVEISTEANTDWKLTLKDNEKSVALIEGRSVTKASDGTITVPYTYKDKENATEKEKVNQISVMITDKAYDAEKAVNTQEAQILYYGALQDIKNAEGNGSTVTEASSGTGTFALPSGLTGTLGTDYHIYLLAEHVNDDNNTDYASEPLEVEVKTPIETVTVPSIDTPIAEQPLQTEITVPSTGVEEKATLAWKKNDTEATGNAEWKTTYQAYVTLTAADGYAFTDTTGAILNEQPVSEKNITLNEDGTLTIACGEYTTATRKTESAAAPEVPTQFANYYTADNVLSSTELGTIAKVTLEGSAQPNPEEMEVEWSIVDANGASAEYDATPEATNIFKWTVKESEYADYDKDTAVLEGTVTIQNKDYTPVTITGENVTVTYHGEDTLDVSQYFTIDENAGTPTYELLDTSAGTGTLDGKTLTMTTLGTFAIKVSTPINGVYNKGEHTLTITVNKAAPNVTALPTVADRIYHPSTVLADTDITGGTVKDVSGNSLAGTWSWKEADVIPTVDNDGYVAVFTPEDTVHYQSVEKTISVNVSKATPYIKTAPTATAITYGEALSASTLKDAVVWYSESDEEAVEGTFTWKEAATKPTVADSDKTEYDVVFTPTDAENYNTVETKITLTVNKADNTPNMPEDTELSVPYGTKTVGTVELPEGWVWSEADSAKELTVGKAVEATAIYNSADKGNYVTESVIISITREACAHAGETEVKDAKKATCAVDGYTGDTYCKDCGAKIATGTKIDKSTTHTWDNGVVTKEATATEKGEKTYTCSVCKTTKKEEIPALGAPKVGEEIASEDGSATYKVTEAGENGNSVTYEAPTDKNQATVVVPATVTINNITYNVTTISDTAFAGNKKLTSVTIGDNVTGFSDKTFKGCSNLKTVNIGNGVTSIPTNAFKNFKNLTTVKMGTGVKTIGKNAFSGCKKLKNVTIGKNVVTIGDKAFYKCTSLTKVTIPSKVKTIGKSTFEGCKALKTITIGKSVTKIGSKAFYGCSKTKTLTIKSSKLTTKKIGSKAFTKTPKSMTVKVPKKKFKAYKSMFIKRGVNKKARFKKS